MSGPETPRGDRVARLTRLLEEGRPRDRSEGFLVEAPLRVCPLGAHVDHQGGVVTGMTIDRSVLMAVEPLSDPVVQLSSLDFPGEVTVDLTHRNPAMSGDWGDYLRAAATVLGSQRPLKGGFRAVVGGDLPGAGLSSSAAVLVAYLLALAKVNGFDLRRQEISSLVQRAENEYVGVASGRLDQSMILYAEAGKLTRVDCADMSIQQIPLPASAGSFRILVAYSGVGRALVGSGFNTRVDECHQAARLLLDLGGQATHGNPILSEVQPEIAERFLADLPRGPRRRAAHYFGEQRRVASGVDAWRQGDLPRFGALMSASGASSIHNFESGTAELVTLYELLREAPGVFGTRFSGGGFGGSCIALIEPEAAETIIERVAQGYAAAHPRAGATASFHVCRSGGPATLSDVEA